MGLCQYTVINPHALQEWGIRYETYIKPSIAGEYARKGTFSLVWSVPVCVGSLPWSAVIISKSSFDNKKEPATAMTMHLNHMEKLHWIH